MAIFSFFKKNKKILVRCTYCYDEFELTPREVRLLQSQNANSPICAIKEECHICHIGFVIPVKYTDKTGKQSSIMKLNQKSKT